MGSGPSEMEAGQADEGSEKTKLGSQYSGTGCLPTSFGAPQPEHKLDHSSGQRLPRATKGCDGGRSAHASASESCRETSIHSAGNGSDGESGWAKRDHHRAG